MTTVSRIVLVASACLALGACGKKDSASGQKQAGSASGKILERSITDDMLPYDTVTSQPPRASHTQGTNETGHANITGKSGDAGKPEETKHDESAPEAAPMPAED